MSARARIALLLACSLGACSSPALAADTQPQNPLNDQGSSPNYRSTITSISPATPGLQLQVLQFSDRLLLRNGTGKTVEIRGYEGEQYARVQPSGSVEVNTHSPAYYLNQSFYGNVTVPSFATPSATPRWQVVDRTGQFEWHDHRIHWMSPVLPPQVKDRGKRTLIFDWRVPIAVGSQSGNVAGTLYWTPNASSASVAVIVIGALIVVLGIALSVVVRRRRARSGPSDGSGVAGAGGTGEARPSGAREAW
ncbi:MAG TPA: hypothetical protein VGX69_05680 [Solirubrobacteraceae bacterium]|jgi:hypothetical protein|nr:hypothetical protein [Solirubrobacteraceae bacterium]